MITNEMRDKLIAMAREASRNAYVPYSHFKVGAAILGEKGGIYTGCNVENAAYGSTMLAFEGISYVFTAQKHLCEARLRGAQKMGLDAPDGRAIFEAAAAGNARTLAVLNDWISEIAQGLAGLVHIFNPQLILIGGGVSAQQELLIDPLAAQVCKSVMPAFAEGLEIKAAALQNDAGLVGAVYYFRENQ